VNGLGQANTGFGFEKQQKDKVQKTLLAFHRPADDASFICLTVIIRTCRFQAA
jgi:hypothetical protein